MPCVDSHAAEAQRAVAVAVDERAGEPRANESGGHRDANDAVVRFQVMVTVCSP